MNRECRSARRDLAQEFVQFAVEAGVLRFGEFKTKAGRLSPYFFNAGLFDDGAKLGAAGGILCTPPARLGLAFDMLFGPAYKGITLAAAAAVELARLAATCRSPTTARRPRTTAKAARWSARRWPAAS